jgi:hypothetical protein
LNKLAILLQLDPYRLAYVSFTPSAFNPHPEFADEVYFPPQTEEDIKQDLVMGPGTVDGKLCCHIICLNNDSHPSQET